MVLDIDLRKFGLRAGKRYYFWNEREARFFVSLLEPRGWKVDIRKERRSGIQPVDQIGNCRQAEHEYTVVELRYREEKPQERGYVVIG